MNSRFVTLRDCRFEILTEGPNFRGIGKAYIGRTQVRSGRLPLTVWTQTFSGLELTSLRLRKVEARSSEIRVRLEALFRPLPVKLMRDHSFDPIHDLGDWDRDRVAGGGRLDLVLRPARDEFGGLQFEG